MSVFRIQRKKCQPHILRRKVHSQQSKPSSPSRKQKNLTEILFTVKQKLQKQLPIARGKVFGIQGNQEDSNKRIKRISETYNIGGVSRKDGTKGARASRKSFATGDRVWPSFPPRKKSQQRIDASEGVARSSPKLQPRLFTNRKGNLQQQLTLNKSHQMLQKRKRQLISFDGSFASKRQTNSTREATQQRSSQLGQLYKQALEQYKLRNVQKALGLFEIHLKQNPAHLSCLYYIGSCYLNLKNNAKSLKYLTRLLSIDPSYNQTAYLYVSINLRSLNKDFEAIKYSERGIKMFPQSQELLHYAGKLCIKNKRYDKAVEKLERCIQINQGNYIARIMLGDALKCMGRWDEAIQAYKSVFDQDEVKQQRIDTFKISQSAGSKVPILEPTSPDIPKLHEGLSAQLAYLGCLTKYSTLQTRNVSEVLSTITLDLQLALNQSRNAQLSLSIMRLILKLHIDYKDIYAAELLLNRGQQTIGIRRQSIEEWWLFVHGANDIIKRKNQQGKGKLQTALSKIEKKVHKANSQLQMSDLVYLRLNITQYLAYTEFGENNIQKSFQLYQRILSYGQGQGKLRNNWSKLKNECFAMQIQCQRKLRVRHESKFSRQILLSKVVVEAMIEHRSKGNFRRAKELFQQSLEIRERTQGIFLWSINQIGLLRDVQMRGQQQESNNDDDNWGQHEPSWSSLNQMIEKAQKISPNNSLIHFYHSLVELHLERYSSALEKVQKSIQCIQQPPSQYFFIQALCFYLLSQIQHDHSLEYKAIEAISRAIELDPAISQFYKQRSKHYFCSQNLTLAIQDCQKCFVYTNDQQARLLNMFYLYLQGDYDKSFDLLNQIVHDKNRLFTQGEKQLQYVNQRWKISLPSSSPNIEIDHNYLYFEHALMFRLKRYDKIGTLSLLIKKVVSKQNNHKKRTRLPQQYLKTVEQLLYSRKQQSQFTVYFISLVLAVYYIYSQKQYVKGSNYLFLCLEEIQFFLDEKSRRMQDIVGREESSQSQLSIKNNSPNHHNFKELLQDQLHSIDTESMLDQIKYNIVICTLLKNTQQFQKQPQSLQNQIQLYSQTWNLIQTFIQESQSQELKENLGAVRNLVIEALKELRSRNKDQLIRESKPKLSETNTNINTNIYTNTNTNVNTDEDIKTIHSQPFEQVEKFSDQFQEISIKIGNKCLLVTKFIVFYPAKLTFNIKPGFDQSFLFNFDIDKVQNKLVPPWFKFSEYTLQSSFKNKIIFTDQLRNQSIALTSIQQEPSFFQSCQKSKHRYQTHQNYIDQSQIKFQTRNSIEFTEKTKNLKNIMKLDSTIQKKLKKILAK